MKKEINVFEYAEPIMKAVEKGVLVTAKADGRVNSMSIAWGTLGIQWNKPIFMLFIRESRFTRELLDKNPEFTVNIPVGDYDKKIIGVCGTKSGRDMDKAAELGLTLVDGETVSVPAIRELPLTIECKTVYRQEQEPAMVAEPLRSEHYPEPVDSHIAYYGEITAAYILE